MKVAGKMRKEVFFLWWWFRVAVQLCFFLGVYSEKTSFRSGLRGTNSLGFVPSPVKLNTENPKQVVIDNGIVSINLANPEGYILGISYNGIENVLDARNEDNDRGYMDVVWKGPGQSGGFQRIRGTSFSVMAATENIVEVSFLRTWTSSMRGSSVPINIDKRYILRRGDSGFYSYVIFERPEGLPAVGVDQIRLVFKLNRDRFNYMAISDTRQRRMPSMRDRETGQRLAYPEAVLLTHPSNPQFRGEVDDKYQYSTENTDCKVHGWITADSEAPVGFWMITPSNEFQNAGPIKQDLTSHVGPTTLSMFVSTHYAGKGVNMKFQQGETYKKVFGPVFVYLNSAPNNVRLQTLWSDAVRQLSNEVKSWPYDFPRSKDFLPRNQRGTVSGRLQVQDGYIGKRSQNAINAYIGLALPGNAGSWQKESKGYQFWTRTDSNGYFVIKNIVPGVYNLYGWVPGFIGDYKYYAQITITPGCTIKLDSLVYSPPRNGPTLWEIGFPDRSAAEFHVPDPYPTLMNYLYKNDDRDKFRQYGLWERYADLYPNHDLVYTVGVNNYKKDWFFAHVPRSLENNTYQPTIWQIRFELQNNILRGTYTLQLALASSSNAEVQVRFNDPSANPPHFTTGLIGDDNAIARHGIHGLHRLYSISIASDHLVQGKNTIYLRQPRAREAFQGVMYDYIRLESPPTPAN
ncbi:probable rhamnogalacturonate lyase B [Gastrolobium bilobum]|uniref:probable rhamnogalacturonate lyase B n=1 Tax=Gastrolobium bilobum TaxID=150636 RepID=UPI002AB041A6|nr:probable rhamnogalacturonate lyase B [Gastrolobium bilobum]